MNEQLAIKIGLLELMFMRLVHFLKTRNIPLVDKSIKSFQYLSDERHGTSFDSGFSGEVIIGDYRIQVNQYAHLYMRDSDGFLEEGDSLIHFVIRKIGVLDELVGISYELSNKWGNLTDTDSDPVLRDLVTHFPTGGYLSDEQALELIASWVAYLQNLEKAKS